MAKNIILLSDGTGNSSAKLFRTNVWRTYEALDLTGPDQVAYYDNGVGSSTFAPLKILGGVFGIGLGRNVREIFQFLCENYTEGDRIYCFGFSRGAFTIRILTGLINQGIVKFDGDRGKLRAEIAAAYREVRSRFTTVHGFETLVRAAKNWLLKAILRRPDFKNIEMAKTGERPVTFVGVWDTVAAYGLPIEEMTKVWDYLILPLSFPDQIPSDSIGKACHALSLDDERLTFRPLLWNEEKLGQPIDFKTTDKERITQVWFAGVHSDLGGGYPDDGLAHVPLSWMMEEAQKKGLRFRKGALGDAKAKCNPAAKVHDSRKALGAFYRYSPRNVGLLSDDRRLGKAMTKWFGPSAERERVKVCSPKIHHSVFDHISANPDGYAPIGLPAIYRVVGPGGAIAPRRETRASAAARVGHTRRVWNKALIKRVTTFIGIFVVLGIVLAPHLVPQLFKGTVKSCDENIICYLSSLLESSGRFLPAILGDILKSYARAPWLLISAIALGYAATRIGSRAEQSLRRDMRGTWTMSLANALPRAPTGRAGFLNRIRRSRHAYGAMTAGRLVIGFASVVALVFAALNVTGRAAYPALDAVGFYCPRTNGPLRPEGGFVFDTRQHCAPTGIELIQGKRYRVTLEVDIPWRDDSTAASLRGVIAPPAVFKLVGWLKRRPSENWFAPILRIGSTPGAEVVVFPAVEEPDEEERQACETATTVLEAAKTGELHAFVNDATLLWWSSFYYLNNRGTARINVKDITDSLEPASSLCDLLPLTAE